MYLLWIYIWLALNGPPLSEASSNPNVSHPNCISSLIDQARLSDPRYRHTSGEIEHHYRQHFLTDHVRGPMSYTLPVVIYVIEYPLGGSSNPTDSDITMGIDLLNRVLDGQDACDGNNSGVSSGISFCLASRDIYGAGTTGIVRISNTLSSVDLCTQELALKNLVRQNEDAFPNTDYVNIYIVSTITASCIANGESVAGFASYPAAHGTIFDGIVIESSVFTAGNCDLFKVLVHETGHYFNLLHTFEGGCKNENCLEDGDRVCDTPPDTDQDIYPSNPCYSGSSLNSCSTDVNPLDPNNPFTSDQDDLTDNFMDYAPTSCAKRYTNGQVSRMHAAIEGPRKSLLESLGCQPPCVDPPNYVLDISDDTLQIGNELVIVPIGSNITDDSYWSMGDEIFPGSQLHWVADTTGQLTFIFHPFHIDPTCSKPDTIVIQVDCYLQPQLVIDNLTPEAGDSLLLTSPGSNEVGLNWYIDGKWVGQGDTLIWQVPTEGSYQVKLEYCDATCCGSTVEFIMAGECPSGQEGNLWMFARDGITLDFSSGQPKELPPIPSSSFADEASSIVCDKNGNLLFYTNGEYVWDRNNTNLTPHGAQIFQWLRGNRSSTNILSLPFPDKPYLYYIFYNTSMQGDPLGFGDDTTTLYFATIDMRLNGGLGGVVQRNVLLKRGMTEKIAATRHCNGRDWWLLSYQASTKSFLAWLIDSDGIQQQVSSMVGVGLYDNYNSRAGEINFSPDGAMVATAFSFDISIPGAFGAIELFKFDNSTGIVSDPILMKYYDSSSQYSSAFFYGLEFSPNNQYLYATSFLRKPAQQSISTVIQFCLDPYNQDSIRNSEYNIFYASPPDGDGHDAMQTGRDGKIYLARYSDSTLSIINYPNLKEDACGFEHRGLHLQFGESFVGLPSIPNGIYTPEKPYIHGPNKICDTMALVQYFVTGNCKPQDQEWKVLGTSSIMQKQGDTVWISPAAPGFDTLVVTRYTPCRTVTDTLIYEVYSCQSDLECSPDFQWISADTILCSGEGLRIQYSTNATVVRFLNEVGQTIGLGNSSTFYQFPSPPEGDYSIYLWSPEGCDTTISFNIQYSPSIGFNWIQYDSVICSGQIANISFTSFAERTDLLNKNGDWIEMNPNQPLQFGPLYQDTSIQIRLRNSSWDCDTMVTASIRVGDIGSITTDSLFLCSGDSILLWSSWIKTPGEYDSLFQNKYGCDSTSVVRVKFNPSPLIEKVDVKDAICGNLGSIEIHAADTENLEYAVNTNPYSSNSTIDSLPAGKYNISVRNESGCISTDTIEITLHNPPSISNTIVTEAECGMSNGSVQIIAHADNSPLEYSIGGSLFVSNSVFTTLPAGMYQVFVKDTFGCMVDQQIAVPNLDGPQIIEIQTLPEYCEMGNGEINILASSTSGNLFYSIDGFTFFESHIFTSLQSDSYQIVVQDSNGCEIQASVVIPNVDATLIESVSTTVSGCDIANGIIEIVPSEGDVTGYSLERQNFQISPRFETLLPGNYTIYLLSHGVCLDSAVASISKRSGPTISEIQIMNPVCPNDLGQISISVNAESGLTFSIDSGISWGINPLIDGLIPGDYSVIVRDSFGCRDSQYVHISAAEDFALIRVETISSNCNTGGQIKAYAIGDSLEYRLNENIYNSDGLFSNLGTGVYLLSIYNKNGCLLDSLLTVTETACDIFMANVFSPNGDGLNDYFGPQLPIEIYQLGIFEIYDRWGNAVFNCNQADECQWNGMFNGKQSPSGVYAWRLVYTDSEGLNQVLTGDVTLIR